MKGDLRIGAETAPVTLFAKGGRDFRLDRRKRGHAVPREFFYGFFDLEARVPESVMKTVRDGRRTDDSFLPR